jgi:hypothetical protein
MLTAYIITMNDHPVSSFSANECINHWNKFTKIPIVKFDATIPPNCEQHYKEHGLYWNPIGHGSARNLPKTALNSVNVGNLSKASSAMSHIRLWHKAASEDIIVLEHDSELIRELTDSDIDMIQRSPYGIVSLWYEGIEGRQEKRSNFFFHPDKSDLNFPDLCSTICCFGGNAAYYIKSWAAKAVLEKLYEIGYMPCANDTFLSDWFGFDFIATPETKKGWTDTKRYERNLSGNWLLHWKA